MKTKRSKATPKIKVDGWLNAKAEHKVVMKDLVTKRSYCDEPSCKFYGKLVEQGVCHTVIKDKFSNYFSEMMEQGERILAFNRKHDYKKLSQKQLIKRLEDEVVCFWMNHVGCLNELIWLRGENAKLRARSERSYGR